LGFLRIFFVRGRIFTKAQATYPRPGEYSHGLGQESLRFFYMVLWQGTKAWAFFPILPNQGLWNIHKQLRFLNPLP